MKSGRILALAALLFTTVAGTVEAQRYFGQNQFGYRHFRWQVLETEHFKIHYYPEERLPIKDAARMAERAYTRLTRMIPHQFREKKPILLFATRADFGANNVTGDLGEGTGGVTDGSRQRIMMPFTGDYASFERVLIHEMVHQFQYDVFARGKAGANLQLLDQVNPPLWFMEGMAEYLAMGPNHPLTATWMRTAVANGSLPTIKEMTERPDKHFPYRYGEALWGYVGERWGDGVIGAILQSATSVGIERAFQKELGITLDKLSDDWREAMRAKYLSQLGDLQRVEDFARPVLTPKITGGTLFLAPVLSYDGNMIAFLSQGSQKRGEIFIDLWLGDARTGKRLRRLVKSTTNPRFEELRLLYSQGGFSRDGRYFAFTAQTGGRDVLSIVDVKTGRTRQLKDIPLDGVLSPTWSPDGKQIAFSGVNNAVTDLYIVNADGTNLRAITKDRYGALQPSWSPDGKYIAFSTDRETTKLDNLDVGSLQIAVANVEDGTIDVLPGQEGLNINPVWSPDGSALAYISDRSGIANVYLYELGNQSHYRLTNVLGSVGAITEYSPALTWSQGADRLAFTYFGNAGGNDYTVWSIDNPLAYKQPLDDGTVLATDQRDTVVRDSVPDVAQTGDSTVSDTSEQRSTYRSRAGTRRSAVISSRETVRDSLGVVNVAKILSDPNTGLPDTLTFKESPYNVRFSPEYISGVGIGVSSGGGYGTQIGGGTTLVFADLTGDHLLAVGAGINGRLSDASFIVGYTDLSRRLQHSLGIMQDVVYINTDARIETNPEGGRRDVYEFHRFMMRTAAVSTEYPLDRFKRFEFGLQASTIGRTVVNQNYDYRTSLGFYYVDVNFETVEKLKTLNYVSPLAAFVTDNTLFGTTGPIMGARSRFSISPSLGNIRWMEYSADYRKYIPIVFNTLTSATRVYSHITAGKDENLFPTYIGRPEFVRGYDRANFYGGYACDAFLGSADAQSNMCATAQLVGTRVAVFNQELRFPIIRRFDLGSLPIGLPPVDGLVFFDAGLAWNSGQSVSVSKPADYDVELQRYIMKSYGVGLRVNVFNLAILKWDYAKPIDRYPNNKWNWTFSIGPSF